MKYKFIVAMAVLVATSAFAQPIPTVMIVGFPPGSITDLIARRLVKDISDNGGPDIIIENKVGDSGRIAMRAVAGVKKTEAPRLLLVNNSIYVESYTSKNLNIDVTTDVKPIGYIGEAPAVLVANKDTNIKSIKDLKKSNNSIKYGAAPLTLPYYNMVNMQDELNKKLEFIPYKGSILAFPDLIGGRIDLVPDNYISSKSYIESKQVVPIAVGGLTRLKGLPQVPTFREQGINWQYNQAFYVFGSGNISNETINLINSALAKSLSKNKSQWENDGIIIDLDKNKNFVALNHANIHKYQTYKFPTGQ
jgi:tripartite-type tricarboxylate transporter receptor subunit TctC